VYLQLYGCSGLRLYVLEDKDLRGGKQIGYLRYCIAVESCKIVFVAFDQENFILMYNEC